MYQHAKKPRGPRAAPAQFGTVDHVLRKLPFEATQRRAKQATPSSTIWNCHCICPSPTQQVRHQHNLELPLCCESSPKPIRSRRTTSETGCHDPKPGTSCWNCHCTAKAPRNRLPRRPSTIWKLYCESSPKPFDPGTRNRLPQPQPHSPTPAQFGTAKAPRNATAPPGSPAPAQFGTAKAPRNATAPPRKPGTSTIRNCHCNSTAKAPRNATAPPRGSPAPAQ